MKNLLLLFFFFLTFQQANSQTTDSTIIHAMEIAIENSTYPNINSILIAHNKQANRWMYLLKNFSLRISV